MLGIPSTIKPKRCFDTKNGLFLEKEVLAKVLSGRTIELDEVVEPEQDEQSGAAPKAVLKAATAPMAPAPTKYCSPRDRSTY